jgi:hypothetical protein
MYANVSTVLNVCCLHRQGHPECSGPVVVDSTNFLYGRQKWDRYFAAPPMLKRRERRIAYSTPSTLFAVVNGPVTPRLPLDRTRKVREVDDISTETILLPPSDRRAVHRIYATEFTLQHSIVERIGVEAEQYGVDECLGLHIRGPLRIHGGVGGMKARLGLEQHAVPYHLYFEKVDDLLDRNSFSGLFVFSDSSDVISRVRNRYGNRVISRQGSLLTPVGEPHLKRDWQDIESVGMDIIIEAGLMAKVKFLIHGNSNITNCVQVMNPELEHFDIFSRFYE